MYGKSTTSPSSSKIPVIAGRNVPEETDQNLLRRSEVPQLIATTPLDKRAVIIGEKERFEDESTLEGNNLISKSSEASRFSEYEPITQSSTSVTWINRITWRYPVIMPKSTDTLKISITNESRSELHFSFSGIFELNECPNAEITKARDGMAVLGVKLGEGECFEVELPFKYSGAPFFCCCKHIPGRSPGNFITFPIRKSPDHFPKVKRADILRDSACVFTHEYDAEKNSGVFQLNMREGELKVTDGCATL